jgi:ferrous iron transport protein A
MINKKKHLTHLHDKTEAKIISLEGGQEFQSKLRIMGIREGQKIKIISKQPFRGPLTIAINGCQMTLGRGMAHRIIVEEL